MRKLLWTCCLTGTVVAACLCWSTWYACKNPTSLLGRSMTAGFQLSVQCNPLLNGCSPAAVDVTKLGTCDENVSDCCLDDLALPCMPCPFEESDRLEPAPLPEFPSLVEGLQPLPGVPAIVIDEDELEHFRDLITSTKEPPLACQGPCEMSPLATTYDPEVRQAGGLNAVGLPLQTRRLMPYCKDDEAPGKLPCLVADKEACETGCWFSWCWKMVGGCPSECPAKTESSWFSAWFGCFWSPSFLGSPGSEELSEPKDTMEEPSEDKDEPYHPYHSSDYCPRFDGCPYSGRMPSYEPPVTEPMKESKQEIKLPAWWSGETEDEEDMPLPTPGVDTMEFRPSDRKWDDYGPLFQL